MHSGLYKNSLIGDKHKRKGVILHTLRNIRTYITSLFLLLPSSQIHSEDIAKGQQLGFPFSREGRICNEEAGFPTETAEKMMSFEAMFKHGIQNTLIGLDNINQIPVGGKVIEYYRDIGDMGGKKLTSESIKALNLPDKFDISPRSIATPVGSIYFTLGKRKFQITLDVGNVKHMYLTPEALVVETSLLFDMIYDKENKLPNLMRKLWMSPSVKGEKEGFKLVTITEI